MHKKQNLSIFIADVASAFVYIVSGFLLLKLLFIKFWTAVLFYFFLWFVYIWKYKPIDEKGVKSQIPILVKGILVFLIAFCLLSLKSVLQGIVVTFPFSGVFAVIETKDSLYTLAGEFTKNSLAILIFFIVIKIFSQDLNFYATIGVGWCFYLPTLLFLQKIKQA